MTLELGGDATVIVNLDADIGSAIPKLVRSAYGYAGQVCISAQHALIHRAVYEQTRAALIAATRGCRIGDPADAETVCSAMISVEAATRVEDSIRLSVKESAELLVGGKREGNRLEPALVENVPFETALGSKEAFGPVLTLEAFDALDEAISMTNRSQYGIHAGLFTKDREAIDRAFERLQVTGLVVNDVPSVRFDALPYGGVKRSGEGLEGVRYAYETMTRPKSLVKASDR